MVAPHNFVLNLYLHCLLISTEILHYNGTTTRPTTARGRWTVSHGVAGTIKPAVYGLVKSRHININTAEEIAAEASKGVPSIKSLYLSQEDEIIKPSFVKNAPAIKGTLDVHTIKRNYNLENVCFLAFYYLPDDKEPFHTQYYPRLNTLVCDHERESDEVNENICSHYQKVYDGHSETWLQCPLCSL